MKYAIRVVSGDTGKLSLFAICTYEYTNKFINLANQAIDSGSSDWVTCNVWVGLGDFPHSDYFDYSAGNLF